MAASAELLTPLPLLPKQGRGPIDLSGVSDPDSGLDGSCTSDTIEAPLTSEPPLADTSPLTSEPPLTAELPLTSEPAGVGYGTEDAGI
ncbi:hypothetical protein V1L54_01345 [Streptomyces sp. TRM 70361]|uniref:Uncharacterized protein n=1 Tax=Streptomyces carminius TaxID=2665496 RepID=A0A2M8LQJ4_9ACTN|nr:MULTISPECIES: hypothetical protein [Streptomyces]MEE1938074.1 hypothetical protein [Streptomyces sp. TRM 70361]PJE94206.1 hypothetical protein CUT44_28420 [Streptomyces carminius]